MGFAFKSGRETIRNAVSIFYNMQSDQPNTPHGDPPQEERIGERIRATLQLRLKAAPG